MMKLIINSILLLCIGMGCVTTTSQLNETASYQSSIAATEITSQLSEEIKTNVNSLNFDQSIRNRVIEALDNPIPANLKFAVVSLIEIDPVDDYSQIRITEILKYFLNYDIGDTDPPGQEEPVDVLIAADIRRLATDTLIRRGENIPIEPVMDKFKLSKYIDGWVENLTSKDMSGFNAREKLAKYKNESIYVLIKASHYNNYMKTIEGAKQSLDFIDNMLNLMMYLSYFPPDDLEGIYTYKNTRRLRCEEVKNILRYRLNEWSIPFLKEVYNNKTSYQQKVNIYKIVKGIGEDRGIDYMKDWDLDLDLYKELLEDDANVW